MIHQLAKKIGSKTIPWSNGAKKYLADYKAGPSLYNIAISCQLGRLDTEEIVMLDTGSTWSVINDEIAKIISGDLSGSLDQTKIQTRLGKFNGNLHRLNITLKADWGDDLSVECTVLVLKGWKGPIVLGYKGFLENINFAVEPAISLEDIPTFYFGNRN